MFFVKFIVFITILQIVLVTADVGNLPDETELKFISIDICSLEGSGDPYETEFEAGVDENNEIYVSGKISLRDDLNEEDKFTMLIDKWEDSKWLTQSMVDGKLYEYLQKVGEKAFEKFTKMVEPNWPEEPPIPAGDYEFSKYQINRDELDLPAMMIGRFRLTFRFYVDDQEVACRLIEVETKKKE